MSNKSGTAPQTLGLPTGGGALTGIGETFAADPFTGTGKLHIPLEIPEGRNGFSPQLGLDYSTTSGNGPFGLGWSLSVPSISRKTEKRLPRYGGDDVFVLAGVEDLVPLGRHGNITRYRPRSEGNFDRIEHDHASNEWRVRTKNGGESRFAPALADPSHPERVFSWSLAAMVDSFGNRIVFEYQQDRDEDGVQSYLHAIRYVDYMDAEAQRFLVSVTFEYEPRGDIFTSRRPGFAVTTRLRCSRIDVRTHAETEVVARSYELAYESARNASSLLTNVRCIGVDGERRQALPPIVLGYTGFEPERPRFRSLETAGDDLPTVSLADGTHEVASLFGNGLPDLVRVGDSVTVWRNLGNGTFAPPVRMRDAPTVHLDSAGARLADMTGKGRAALFDQASGGYFKLSFSGEWERSGFVRYTNAPTFAFDNSVRLLDLDGDGVTDALRTGSKFQLFFSDPVLGWRMEERERGSAELFPDVEFDSDRVKLADMSGDALQDIVFVENASRIHYWPYFGDGRWGRRETKSFATAQGPDPTNFEPARLLFGDIDGDGVADLIYVEPTQLTVWINQGGSKWSAPIVVPRTPFFTDIDGIRIDDVLGTGTAGVLWTSNRVTGQGANYRFLDFTDGVKPYLLSSIDNHHGAVTRIDYESSTKHYLADQQRDDSAWKTHLPFPVQVVARVEVIDRVSRTKLVTQYRYHHGYWDGSEREFRGFGRVDQIDSQTFEDFHASGSDVVAPVPEQRFASPVLTKTWFHLGPIEGAEDDGTFREEDFAAEYWSGDSSQLHRPAAMTQFLRDLPASARRNALRSLRGSTLRSEVFGLDASPQASKPYVVTEQLHGISPVDEARVFFPHVLATRETRWERGDEPMTRVSYLDDRDVYGQPRSSISIAFARRPGEPCLATRTVTSFAQRDDEDRFVVDRPAQVATHEIVGETSRELEELHDRILIGRAATRLVTRVHQHYDGADFVGLPLGQLGSSRTCGARARTEELVLTPEIIASAYPTPPAYLVADAPDWPDEYPDAFRATTSRRAGYALRLDHGGYFTATDRASYTSQGLLAARLDSLGNKTSTRYDRFGLLAISVTLPSDENATAMTTSAAYDYRVLAPNRLEDPNGNISIATYTPLGLLETTGALGKAGDHGDSATQPGSRFIYDFQPRDPDQPIWVHTIRRVYHATTEDPAIGGSQRDDTVEIREYSDGFGRMVQTRTLDSDVIYIDVGPQGGAGLPADQRSNAPAIGLQRAGNVVVSGWQVYDNKARVIAKHEPYFAAGWEYRPPEGTEVGRNVNMFYDPLGRLERTINANGSEQLVVYGIPSVLDQPARYTPTPWVAFTYDANDNAGRTHREEAEHYRSHWNTPSSAEIDALGRTISSTRRLETRELVTATRYDIQGNALERIDELRRVAERSVFDVTGRRLHVRSMDSGSATLVYDAGGGLLESRDDRGALVLAAFDAHRRPSRGWARDRGTETVTLRTHTIYGDDTAGALGADAARAANLHGVVWRHYDEAGLASVEQCDFDGNVTVKVRRVFSDRAMLQPGFRVDWEPPRGTTLDAHASELLDSSEFRTTMRHDALGRPIHLLAPKDVDGERKELRPRYDRGGRVTRMDVGGTPFVDRIAYDASGRQTLVAFGNGVMSRYCYDRESSQLVRVRSESFRRSDDGKTYTPSGSAFQDVAFTSDLVGNVTSTREQATDEVLQQFEYDGLYRLRTATGREADIPLSPQPWADPEHDVSRTRAYREAYEYDDVGNLTVLRHQAPGSEFTRAFALAPDTNQLRGMEIGQTRFAYEYDATGNLVSETSSRRFEWDYRNRLRRAESRAGNSTSVETHYLYDAQGQRVKKLTRKQGGRIETTIYIDGLFEHDEITHNGQRHANNTLHILDGARRVATVRVGAALPEDTLPKTRYELGDHLGNASVTLTARGELVDRAEYTPFGESSFATFGRKRYRFGGKERDAETGFGYFGARYYAPWLGRWTSTDPAGTVDGLNGYVYTRNNPSTYTDPTGLETLNEKIENMPSGVGYIAARIGYGLWNVVSLGSLGRTDTNETTGSLGGDLLDHSITGVTRISNTASLGLQDHIYESQMKDGPGLWSIAKGAFNAGKALLPVDEIGVLADPKASAEEKWAAGFMGISKTASLGAFGAGLAGKNPVLTGPKAEVGVGFAGPGVGHTGVTIGESMFDKVVSRGAGKVRSSSTKPAEFVEGRPFEYASTSVPAPRAAAAGAAARKMAGRPQPYNLFLDNCGLFVGTILQKAGIHVTTLTPRLLHWNFVKFPHLGGALLRWAGLSGGGRGVSK